MTDSKTVAAALFTVLAWASAFVVTRAVAPHIHPGPLSLGRLAIGLLVLGVFLLRTGWVKPARRDWLLVGACGAVWFGFYNLALAGAARRLDAGTTAMLVSVGPLLIALLAARFLGERLSRWLLAGAVVSMAGVALIAQARAPAGARPTASASSSASPPRRPTPPAWCSRRWCCAASPRSR